MTALALTDALAAVPDPRSRHGRIHPLPAVLALVVLGLLMGKKSLAAVSRLGRLYGTPLAHALGFRRGKTPAKSMLSEQLRALNAHAVGVHHPLKTVSVNIHQRPAFSGKNDVGLTCILCNLGFKTPFL